MAKFRFKKSMAKFRFKKSMAKFRFIKNFKGGVKGEPGFPLKRRPRCLYFCRL